MHLPECLASLAATLCLFVRTQVQAAGAEMVPWGFVLFCGLVLLITHLRRPGR